jgi:hypothetical protein
LDDFIGAKVKTFYIILCKMVRIPPSRAKEHIPASWSTMLERKRSLSWMIWIDWIPVGKFSNKYAKMTMGVVHGTLDFPPCGDPRHPYREEKPSQRMALH